MSKLRKILTLGALLMFLVSGAQAATTFINMGGIELQVSEATAVKRTIYYEVGTAEVQTVTVSKAGGAFGATAGSAYTAVDGTMAKMTLHATDLDTEGFLALKSVGATDTVFIYNLVVVDHDPFDDIAVAPTDYLAAAGLATTAVNEIVDQVWDELLSAHVGAGTFGKSVADAEADATLIVADTGTDGVVVKAAGLDTDAAEEISDTVWDELLSAHVGAGSFGKSVADTEADATLIVADTGTDGVILKASGLDTDAAEEVSDTVWDELLSAHVGAGSYGKSMADTEADATLIVADTGTDGVVLAAAGLGTDAAEEVADTVWDELLSAHVGAGSYGKSMADTEADATLIVADTGTDGVVLAAAGLATDAVNEIVDATLDETLSGHTGSGSLGKAVADIETDATAILADTGTDGVILKALGLDTDAAEEVSDTVWDELLSAHVGAGSFGKSVADAEADATLIVADTGTDGVIVASLGTDALNADALATTAVTEISSGVNAENSGVYIYRVHKNEPVAKNRTLYFRALGTLPANASISRNGGTFANSTNAPTTVNGNFRSLVLTRAETNYEGRLLIDVTTTGTISYVTIIVTQGTQDPFTGRGR